MTRTIRPAVSLLATTALALTLGACKFDQHQSPPAPVAAAPPLAPLAADYAPAVPAQAYAYPQRAYAMSRTVYQRPPSYAFGYGGEQPWVWDDGDQGTMFAEPVADGYRYYYYDPGQAYPYFVQDSDYGYAYGANGGLVALFAATGALIAADHYRDYAPRAEHYWTRGYDLDRTYRRSPRIPVQAADWRERAPALVSGHDRWFRAASAQPAWREAAAHHGGEPRGGDHRGRQFAAATPALPAFGPETHGAPGPRREVRDQPAHGPVRGPAQAQLQHGPMPGREAHGPQAHHGQAFVRTAESHGRDAGAHGRAPPQARVAHQPSGGHGGQSFARAAPAHGQGHGGGDHGGGHGPAQFRAPPQAHAQAPQHGPPGGGQHDGGQHGGGQHGGGQGGHGGGQAGHGGGGDHGGHNH